MGREYIDTTGKTIDEAIAAALAELKMEREDISVEILTQPKQGFLGFGGQSAKIRAYYDVPDRPQPQQQAPVQQPRPRPQQQKPRAEQKPRQTQQAAAPETQAADSGESARAQAFLGGLLEKMNVQGAIEIVPSEKDGEKQMNINISGKDMGVVIGRRGEMLDAIQYITSLVVNRDEDKHIRVTLDTENYRAKREESLEGLARRMADKALKYKKNVTLEPMNSHERRIIHASLQNVAGVTTFSTGSEPYRRVVIAVEGARQGGERKPQGERRPQNDFGGKRRS